MQRSHLTIIYDYDPLHRLTSASYSTGAEYEYTYDAVGNRQTMTSPDGQLSYAYDAANRLTSVGGVAYTWDANGNLTSDGVRSYSYDHANRLTQVTQGSLTTLFAYNGDRVRTSKTVAGDTTAYVLDLMATLPVVISDTEAVYLYGLDIIAQQQAERLYYVHDGLGSVRQLVDTTGQIETNYAYDPFGVPVMGSGVYNPYQYTGEAWDAEVGLLYLRARYYQPEVGRSITKDPWSGHTWEPGTLNRYAYARNGPVNFADPSGLQDADYDPSESYRQATGLVHDWLWEEGEVKQEFGPNEPLTQDVRYSRGVQEFKRRWAEEGDHEVPWWWTEHRVEGKEGLLPVRVTRGIAAYQRANVYLAVCRLGLGSAAAEGQTDPVDATLGSLDEISVHLEGSHRLRFEVFNATGWASATRFPGTDWHPLNDVARGDSWGWGGTVYQLFYWFEPAEDYPDLMMRPNSGLLNRLWDDRW